MTQRALDADRCQLPSVEEAGDADDGVEAEKGHGGGRVVEVDGAALQRDHEGWWQPLHVDLQAEPECCARAQTGADTAEPLAGDGFVQTKAASPESLVAKRIKSKGMSTLLDQTQCVLRRRIVSVMGLAGAVVASTTVRGGGDL